MSDRELLEKAAWAIGRTHYDGTPDIGPNGDKPWNPLEDDGDAFRLALRCQMDVSFGLGGGGATTKGGDMKIEVNKYLPSFATRRAIVRAAAAMVD